MLNTVRANTTSALFWTVLASSFLAGAGCGETGADYSKVELVAVSGKVTLDGQPLANAVVTFDASDGQFAYGLTDTAGAYSLRLDSVRSGCTPGPKTVRISTTRKIVGLNATEGEGSAEVGEGNLEKGEGGVVADRVPPRYNAQSVLKADVSSSQRTFDFSLQSK
ncbi:MAG: carboxypeptidase regulatory-like domain-containing protein [Planctomycetota bacterium]